MDNTEIIWLIVMAVCILVEIGTLGLTTIWFAGGALITFFVSMFTDNLFIQVPIFLVISTVLLVFTRPIAKKYLNSRRTKTNAEGLVGSICRVTEQIDNFHETGTVMLNGVDWTARNVNDELIPIGAKVCVRQITGVKAIVEKIAEDSIA